MAGRTGALTTHVGDLVRANDTTPLVTINQLSPIDVTFSVPGRLLADVQRYNREAPLTVSVTGQPATLPGAQAAAADSRPAPADTGEGPAIAPPRRVTAEGKVTFIDNAVDPATATIKMKATFANTDRTLWPGLFVQVAMQLADQPNAVVIPSLAVQTSQQGQYVYVVTDAQTVEMRTVTVEREQGDAAIIASGLRQGERVVTEGQLRLTPGVKITATAGVAAS
jgi:multidrug efflux system membrane fusion protein